MTFIIAWLREHGAQAGEIALFWAVLGLATILAPPVWRRALAEWPGGRPLAAVLVVMAVGGALPLWQTTTVVMLLSAVTFGGSFLGRLRRSPFSRAKHYRRLNGVKPSLD